MTMKSNYLKLPNHGTFPFVFLWIGRRKFAFRLNCVAGMTLAALLGG
jgi:hypothetical protein